MSALAADAHPNMTGVTIDSSCRAGSVDCRRGRLRVIEQMRVQLVARYYIAMRRQAQLVFIVRNCANVADRTADKDSSARNRKPRSYIEHSLTLHSCQNAESARLNKITTDLFSRETGALDNGYPNTLPCKRPCQYRPCRSTANDNDIVLVRVRHSQWQSCANMLGHVAMATGRSAAGSHRSAPAGGLDRLRTVAPPNAPLRRSGQGMPRPPADGRRTRAQSPQVLGR